MFFLKKIKIYDYLWLLGILIFRTILFLLEYVELENVFIFDISRYLLFKIFPKVDLLNGGMLNLIFLFYIVFSIMYNINYKFLLINLFYVVFQLCTLLYPILFNEYKLLDGTSMMIFIFVILIHLLLILFNVFLINLKRKQTF
ncbi:MAG: hypothetical protein PT934_01480 [Peptoniphilaceae bacterium]|uniref:hypothetical protein n=1 Tax=Parvimonas sp. TaxID=1944660 RepID=UPI0025F39B07|nr:hypothetical protein [Parvimonas sp.]MCI5997995.1 hypothetical protein [Parvimonas sp.]MDD7764419.1 hypothetical protein [Peptoniphilaceae bacterium]MDY3051371.1 hypothetical protein [Parvimonas sp.]